MKDQLKAITKFLETSHKVEGFIKRKKTCYILQIKPEDNIDIRDINVPETTNCGAWEFLWVATNGTFNQGKLMVVPKWKKAKNTLRDILEERYKALGFDDLTARILTKVVRHKPFERNKMETFKHFVFNGNDFIKLLSYEEKPNVEKYAFIESLGLVKPEDYKTYQHMVSELKKFYKIIGKMK